MKKLIVFEVIVLVLLLALTAAFLLKPGLVSLLVPETTAPATEAPTEAPTDPPTEPPTESSTEPPTEAPTEPLVTIELQDSWRDVLYEHEITAPSYFVYDLSNHSFLALSDGLLFQRVYPASITKLFSAYVALQYLDPEETVTVGSAITLIDPDSSTAGLQEGDVLTVEQLVAAMLMPSGNDAAYVLAAEVGRYLEDEPGLDPQAAVERFVEQMNFQTKAEGMFGSHFVTPDGMHDENHYVSVPDMIIMARKALADPILSRYMGTVSLEIPLTEERTLTLHNTNRLLYEDSDYYCPYAIGMKTGFTNAAGNCLLSMFQVEDQTLLIGVFGCEDSYERYADILLLFTEAYGLEVPAPDSLPEETIEEGETTESESAPTEYDLAA